MTENAAPSPPTNNDHPANQIPFVPLVADNQTPKDYGSAKNYADAVRSWLMLSHNWLQCQHQHFLQNNATAYSNPAPVTQIPTTNTNNNANAANTPVFNIHHRRVLVDQNAIRDIQPAFLRQQAMEAHQLNRNSWYRRLLGLPQFNYQSSTIIVQRLMIPPFSRRVIAEIIDFFILFLIKMVIVYSLVEIEAIDLDQLESILNNSADLQTLIDLTQGLFHLEVISKIFSGILEALCITYGFASYPHGCTPGKFIMGLRIVSCVNVQEIAGGLPNQVMITRHTHVSLKNSLIRSLIKNSITNFLFPINCFFYTFQYNRSIYDLAAKTIVVAQE